jgi:hypothetical protein
MSVYEELAPRFREVQWLVQRVLWVLAALVLLAALLGFFGGGPLTAGHKTVQGDGYEFELTYNRWNRQKNPQELDLDISGSALAGQMLQVTLSNSFLDDVGLDGVTPDPDSTGISEEGAVYRWELADGDEFSVTFDYSSENWRTLEGDVVVAVGDSRETLNFSQFLFP